eukprot:730369-Alexandrium_andersonii.AAC.1
MNACLNSCATLGSRISRSVSFPRTRVRGAACSAALYGGGGGSTAVGLAEGSGKEEAGAAGADEVDAVSVGSGGSSSPPSAGNS